MATAVHENDSENRDAASIATDVRPRGRPSKTNKASRAEHRLQVKMTEAGKERLDDLIDRTGGETAAHVVRDALRVYDILTEEVIENGGSLFVKDGDTGEMMKLRLW